MTVLELKELLEGLDDDMVVLIPTEMEFDGTFYSPCIEESGEAKLDNKESFILVPCGFFSDDEHEINPKLN